MSEPSEPCQVKAIRCSRCDLLIDVDGLVDVRAKTEGRLRDAISDTYANLRVQKGGRVRVLSINASEAAVAFLEDTVVRLGSKGETEAFARGDLLSLRVNYLHLDLDGEGAS